jgi:hypothetical protein|tara:strand:+ start:27 stop:713 length:687 start_codon:yes stop_codon:yes gene_type:complete
MSCGPGKGLGALNKVKDAMKESMGALTEGANGIMDSLDSLSADLDAKISETAGKLKELLPTIELPELPTLPQFELPKLEIPALSLQLEIGSVLGKLNSSNPLDKAKALLNMDSLKDKFPKMPAAELNALIADLKAGKINLENLCKLVPNVDADAVEKGTPATAPEKAAEALPPAIEVVDPNKLQEAADKLTGEAKKVMDTSLVDVTKVTKEMLDKIKQIKSQSKFTLK